MNPYLFHDQIPLNQYKRTTQSLFKSY